MRRTLLLGATALAALLAFACRLRPDDANPLGANAGCYVCHMTFVREELSATHLRAKVGCVKCHGVSAAHANDEDVGATKPDITYEREQVDPHCRTCHKTHDAPPEKVVARWLELHAAKPAPKPPLPQIVCTDCHGNHKIAKPQQGGEGASPVSGRNP
jgi:hypothetical protein